MAFVDQVLSCCDCGGEFIFSAGEQEFYQEKGLTNSPKRCQTCRSNRKQQSRGGGQKKKLFNTVCSNCGYPCKVPFKPTEGKPVYCRSCME